MTFRAVLCTWDAKEGALQVVPRFGRLARSQFVDGDEYPVEVIEHRSSKDHSHMFAAIKNAWEHIQDEGTLEVLSTPNKLRQWALIQTGWCDVTVFGPLSRQSAVAAAKTAAINFRKNDDYVEVTIKPTVDEDAGGRKAWLVVIKTAQSQSRAAMKKEPFRDSKRAVLELLAGQIQVRRRELEQSGKDTA